MNIKGESNNLLIFVVIALAVGAWWYFGGGAAPSGSNLSPSQEGGIVNGYYDKPSGQCWVDKDSPPGSSYPIGQIKTSFFQCCLNQEGQQIDCNDPSKVIEPFAIYQGQAGVFSVVHAVTLTNTGNVAITKGWLDSATWTPSNSVLTTAYSGMVGPTSTQAGSIPIGSYRPFSSTAIDLQSIGGTGSPITYTLALVTKGSATNLPDFSKTTPATITVTKESVGFDVAINLNA